MCEKETNETTALILMMSILGRKLDNIANLIDKSNKLLAESLLATEEAEENRTSKVYYMCLTPEDYD